MRRAFGTLLQRGSSVASIVGGLVGSGDMQVTAGSGMQVLIAPGEGWIPGTSTSTQSGYYARVESSTALAIAASSETNNRVDTVIAKVIDKAYAGTEETFSVAVVTGTAEAGVTKENKKGAGAVPASSLVLGYVFVEKKAVSIGGANVENVASQVQVGPPLKFKSYAGAATLGAGELAFQESTGATLTLPSASPASQIVAVFAGVGITAKITASGGAKIYGDFINGETTITLAGLQHVLLESTGASWFIIAGEPKREANYVVKSFTKAEAEAGVEPSATRMAAVVVGNAAGTFSIGGVTIPGLQSTYLVPPGQKWKSTQAQEVATLLL